MVASEKDATGSKTRRPSQITLAWRLGMGKLEGVPALHVTWPVVGKQMVQTAIDDDVHAGLSSMG